MKKLILLLFIPLFFSCEPRMSTEELTEVIKESMIKHFAENNDVAATKLVDLQLVHKGGNEYVGNADVIIENPVADMFNDTFENPYLELKKNMEVTYSVEVIADGEKFQWKFVD